MTEIQSQILMMVKREDHEFGEHVSIERSKCRRPTGHWIMLQDAR